MHPKYNFFFFYMYVYYYFVHLQINIMEKVNMITRHFVFII